MYAVETDRLTKRFRGLSGYRDLVMYPWRSATVTAVEDVTLRIPQGGVFGLLGENGAGKTTLLRMLSTTLLPTSGRAWVNGYDVVGDAQAVRSTIGLVTSDERSFYWRLSGRRNLEFFAALYHVPRHLAKERIGILLETLGAESYADRRFDSYSSGMRQKFAIARAMLTQPQVLFLDEPTRALDPIAADEVRRYVRDELIERLGHTVLLATHVLTEAEELCSSIAIVRHGRVVEEGTMRDVTARMALANVVELTMRGREETVLSAVDAIRAGARVTILAQNGVTRLRVDLDSTEGALDRVMHAVVTAGASIESCNMRRPTLEDVYRAAHADG